MTRFLRHALSRLTLAVGASAAAVHFAVVLLLVGAWQWPALMANVMG